MKGEHIQAGGTSRKANKPSTEVSFKFFFLNVKKISDSTFSLKVSKIKVTKIRLAVFERLIAYLWKDTNRLHRMRRPNRHIVYLTTTVPHCTFRCCSKSRMGFMETIYHSVKQMSHVGTCVPDGVLPEPIVHKFSRWGLTLRFTFYATSETSNYLFYLTLYVPCIMLQCVLNPTRCNTSYKWSLLSIN